MSSLRPLDIVTWVVVSAVAVFFALLLRDSVFVDGVFVPFTNDSFYHASRILDAAGDRGFFQFDEMMHVPEGSWVSWPWGYDYLMSLLASAVLLISPSTDPMSVLVFVPVAWIAVNVALLIAIANRIDLPPVFKVLGVLGFALLPLTQSLHGLGQIDHHYMELCFVLLATLMSLRWLADPDDRRGGILLGIVLGISLIFHHGLFILQLPLLVAVFILWLRQQTPAFASVATVAAALLATVSIVCLLSAPFRDLQFDLSTLSVFHLYVGICSAALLAAMARWPYSIRNLVVLIAVSAVLAVPAAAEIALGTDFLTGNLAAVGNISEMYSPFRMIREGFGFQRTVAGYSYLILLVPVFIAAAIWRLTRERRPVHVGYLVSALMGLGLMLLQFRLNYFGLAFMLLSGFYFLQQFASGVMKEPATTGLVSIVAFAVLFWPTLGGALFNQYPLGGNYYYQLTRPLLLELERHCEESPGIALAPAQLGHYIRYHTDCSVIANNFLLTELHSQKVQEANFLFTVPADVLATGGGGIAYVIAIVSDTHEMRNGQLVPKDLAGIEQRNPQLVRDLVFAEGDSEYVETLKVVTMESGAAQRFPLAGLYRLTP